MGMPDNCLMGAYSAEMHYFRSFHALPSASTGAVMGGAPGVFSDVVVSLIFKFCAPEHKERRSLGL